jgi:CRISPR-associated protein Cas2
MAKMFVVVAYDISDDPRRTKLHNTLKNFGTPVQYSVFECILAKGGWKKM